MTNTIKAKAICMSVNVAYQGMNSMNINHIKENGYVRALLETSDDDGHSSINVKFPIKDAPRIGDTFIIEVTPCK